MNKTALFVDFEDSFSFNVVQELTEAGLTVTVVHWQGLTLDHSADLLVLGPGPGHPDEYASIFPIIQGRLSSQKKIFAICLGHQILWRIFGREIKRSLHPVHGQKVELTLTPEWQSWLKLPERVWVQRYNSLAVLDAGPMEGMETFVKESEVLISKSSHFISYQFHPESVGTYCRQSFFAVIFTNLL